MKNLIFSAAFLLGINTLLAAASLTPKGTDNVILMEIIIEVTPDTHMSAHSVDVELYDASGNVLASGQTSPGQTLSFNRTYREKKVACTYHMDGGQDYVIIIDILI